MKKIFIMVVMILLLTTSMSYGKGKGKRLASDEICKNGVVYYYDYRHMAPKFYRNGKLALCHVIKSKSSMTVLFNWLTGNEKKKE